MNRPSPATARLARMSRLWRSIFQPTLAIRRTQRLQLLQLEDRITPSAPTVTGVGPASGSSRGGTLVTITGTNLASATAVDFGSTPATVVTDTATQIVALSPPGTAGAVDVTVQASGATSATSSADKFTYNAATLLSLATFTGANGADPQAALITDGHGDFFGTTDGDLSGTNEGTVFELTPATAGYNLKTLATFTGLNGGYPLTGSLLIDKSGDLFGTTADGGPPNGAGVGTVFELTPGSSAYTLKTLYTFSGADSYFPVGGLVADGSGDLFGVTEFGGGGNGTGSGTVFELTPASTGYTFTTLVTFTGPNGSEPATGLIIDAKGDLFGTTASGGGSDGSADGTVFELTHASTGYTFSTLFAFTGTNGYEPQAALLEDVKGDLFGTTSASGADGSGDGTVFELQPAAVGYTQTTLVNFNGVNGSSPAAGLIEDVKGDLFGTTSDGGGASDSGSGTVFELTPASAGYNLATLAVFTGPNGAVPYASLSEDASGNLFGTTSQEGAVDSSGSGTVFELPLVTNAASLTGTDTTHQGSWEGVYGKDGYLIPDLQANLSSLPSYAQVSLTGQASYVWNASTSDVRALQQPGTSTRLASCFYAATSFTVDVNLTDGQSHQVSFYVLDWDRQNRNERIDAIDPSTGATLASESVSSFSGGEYVVFNVTGHVQFRFTNTGKLNAVLGGVFFGAGASTTNTATVTGTDTTHQGAWEGTYGKDGYLIPDTPSNLSSLPSYAQVSLTGQTSYVWNASTSDVRALQQPGASTRLASCFYAASSFTVDVNLTDGQSHQVSFYVLDWDRQNRNERIDAIDPSTGATLASESVSGFSGGEYVVFNVTGHVQFRFTNTGNLNAVLGGVFFGGASSDTNAATVTGTDSTHQGAWEGTYGKDGYSLADGPSSVPAYAQMSLTGQSQYIWNSSTSDVRALQQPGSSSRLASCWYSSTNFSVDLDLTDGQSHQVSFYLLDWDKQNRNERIDAIDPITGATLASESVSSFSGGEYVTFNVTGNVQFRFTNTGGLNAVLGGVFFG